MGNRHKIIHKIGLDYAQVIADFNLRAEIAANITEDIDGNDGAVYNPSLAWSLGFDREVLWGIILNVQCNETIRLLDGRINDPQDIESGSDITSTSLVAGLQKVFCVTSWNWKPPPSGTLKTVYVFLCPA